MVFNDPHFCQNIYNALKNKSNLLGGSVEDHDLPCSSEPAWLLGTKYSTIHDREELRNNIRSKILFTYRKNFSTIGGTTLTSDTGWGCMLRCGQMVLAQALINRHLGRGWLWNPERADPVYLRVLRMFQDKKSSTYSIHQIAQMGQAQGKKVGEWFGPATICHVLRKLSVYDEWSNIVIHVCNDGTLFVNDIKKECRTESLLSEAGVGVCTHSQRCPWRPLLLFITLRLGFSTLNPIYVQPIKRSFMMKQSLGILGGRPNRALYFIGVAGNELLYLDPHKTQAAVSLEGDNPDDSSYHCHYGGSNRIKIHSVDTTLALCFYLESEEELDRWCISAKQLLVTANNQPLFEIGTHRPAHWNSEKEDAPPDEAFQHPHLGFTLLDHEPEDEYEIV